MMTLVGGMPLPMPMDRVGLRTMTRKLQLLVLPQPSVATAVTVLVVPRLNKLPEAGVEVTVTEVQASVAMIDQLTGTLELQVITRMFEGQVIAGRLVSLSVRV